jgi:predicted alpha/beta-hydrolase family hydrolase
MGLARAAAGSEVRATRPKPFPDGVWFTDDSTPPVRGFLHTPGAPSGDALVLTHGAGSDCQLPLLVVVATAFAEGGFTVLRCDLPYRQKRRHGPPFRGEDRLDREGLRNAIAALNELDSKPHRVLLGGHSYGGRQASLLFAEDASAVDGLLLLSYPLHPPRRPARTSLVSLEGAGHSLLNGKSRDQEQRRIAAKIRDAALAFFRKAES